MFDEIKKKNQSMKEKEKLDFFFTHIYDECPEMIRQNLSDLQEVKRKIEDQISRINQYSSSQISSHPFSKLLAFHKSSLLSPDSFNSMVENHSNHKDKLSKVIEIIANSSIFKVVSPEGFGYMSSELPLNEVQKQDLTCCPYIIIPILSSSLSLICIDHEKQVLEYYSVTPEAFKPSCEVIEKSLTPLISSDPYDWSLMELPNHLNSASDMLCVFYCLTQNLDLNDLSDPDFGLRLFNHLNKNL